MAKKKKSAFLKKLEKGYSSLVKRGSKFDSDGLRKAAAFDKRMKGK